MGETQLSRIFQLYRGGQFYLMMEETDVPDINHRHARMLGVITLER
jgi:hypothetical protein